MIFNNPNKEQLFDDFLTNYMSDIDGLYKDVNQRYFQTDVYIDTGNFIEFANDEERGIYNSQKS